jgi:hypothetical protein
MKSLTKKLPFSNACPDKSKSEEPQDHIDCESCDWIHSCEKCGAENDGEDALCSVCELARQICLADRMCDEAEDR